MEAKPMEDMFLINQLIQRIDQNITRHNCKNKGQQLHFCKEGMLQSCTDYYLLKNRDIYRFSNELIHSKRYKKHNLENNCKLD
jgi:hypothetical protein